MSCIYLILRDVTREQTHRRSKWQYFSRQRGCPSNKLAQWVSDFATDWCVGYPVRYRQNREMLPPALCNYICVECPLQEWLSRISQSQTIQWLKTIDQITDLSSSPHWPFQQLLCLFSVAERQGQPLIDSDGRLAQKITGCFELFLFGVIPVGLLSPTSQHSDIQL